jgi:hypothetical protein
VTLMFDRPSFLADVVPPCVGMTYVYFPPDRYERREDRSARVAVAKAICKGCEVRIPCAEYGFHEKFGVWGGLDEDDRGRRRRRRSPDLKAAAG